MVKKEKSLNKIEEFLTNNKPNKNNSKENIIKIDKKELIITIIVLILAIILGFIIGKFLFEAVYGKI